MILPVSRKIKLKSNTDILWDLISSPENLNLVHPFCKSNKVIKRITHKIILFEGDLGAGKTTFIKEFCKYLGVKSFVNSPTFSIVNQYSSSQYNTIYHIDLYRINNLKPKKKSLLNRIKTMLGVFR